VCDAELGRDGHKLVVRLSAVESRRERFMKYCARIFDWGNTNCVAVGSG